ncbi:MAG: hypothetical protein D6775_10640 [Caldilineae bacterium]|nr:MAG: hypothetical protein D6775_10640 [Caldilineae bacterium]
MSGGKQLPALAHEQEDYGYDQDEQNEHCTEQGPSAKQGQCPAGIDHNVLSARILGQGSSIGEELDLEGLRRARLGMGEGLQQRDLLFAVAQRGKIEAAVGHMAGRARECVFAVDDTVADLEGNGQGFGLPCAGVFQTRIRGTRGDGLLEIAGLVEYPQLKGPGLAVFGVHGHGTLIDLEGLQVCA